MAALSLPWECNRAHQGPPSVRTYIKIDRQLGGREEREEKTPNQATGRCHSRLETSRDKTTQLASEFCEPLEVTHLSVELGAYDYSFECGAKWEHKARIY